MIRNGDDDSPEVRLALLEHKVETLEKKHSTFVTWITSALAAVLFAIAAKFFNLIGIPLK